MAIAFFGRHVPRADRNSRERATLRPRHEALCAFYPLQPVYGLAVALCCHHKAEESARREVRIPDETASAEHPLVPLAITRRIRGESRNRFWVGVVQGGMSRRRAEGGFSLRTAFSASATTNAPSVATPLPARRAGVPSLPVSAAAITGSKLTFSLQGLQPPPPSTQQQPTSPTDLGGVGPPALSSATPPSSAMPALALTNAFARPLSASVPTNDTMRLNGVIDDLTQRLRKSADKIQHLENANARTSQSFASAKTVAAQQIAALKAELSTVVASETKLRAELSAKPKVAETKEAPFLTSVRSALEADELEQRAAAAEKKCSEMEARQQQLTADLSLLETKREQLIKGMAAGGEGGRSTDELEALISKAKLASRKLEKLDLRRRALEDEVAKFGALADARREDAASALRDATLAAAKVEAAEANLKTVLERAEAAGAAEREATEAAEVNLKTLHERAEAAGAAERKATEAAEEAMQRMPVLPNVVLGSAPPDKLNRIEDNSLARVEMAARTAVGLPFHFDFDAPISLGEEAASAPGVQENDMIKAVVGDLTAYFQNAVVAAAPINHGVGTEAAPVALAAA